MKLVAWASFTVLGDFTRSLLFPKETVLIYVSLCTDHAGPYINCDKKSQGDLVTDLPQNWGTAYVEPCSVLTVSILVLE